MALDAHFIKYLATELKNELHSSKIKKVYNISNNQFVFQTHDKKSIYISCNNEARINLTNKKFVFPSTPSNFTMYLRKYITNFQIQEVEQFNNDRIIKLSLVGLNELKDITYYNLYLELFGRFSNIILCNEDNTILNALKLINNENRTILPNSKYLYDLKDKLPNSKYNFNSDVVNPSYTDKDFYYMNVFKENVKHTTTLSQLLDTFYEKYDTLRRINNLSNSILKKINSKLKSKKNKLNKLKIDLENNSSCDHLKNYGDLILTYGINNNDKNQLKCIDFNNNQIIIPLKPNLSVSDNANNYYNKFQKKKRSIQIIKEQIEITENEIKYLEEILFQLEIANEHELIEITNEFKQVKIKEKNSKSTVLTKEYKGATIYIGKNNVQNNNVTFNISHKSDLWFHIKDLPGSHVVVKNHNNDEDIIKYAASIAGYFSKGRNYPYVDVMYTEIKNVKKISGSYLGHVNVINNVNYIKVEPKYE